jgi:carboxypeptidase C (cathepsin A)
VAIGGTGVPYTVELGTWPLKDEAGAVEAHVFYLYYRRTDAVGPRRPLTFVFNGGPGSSAVWLHMGLVGPKRVVMPDDATFARPPYELRDNPHSILDVTDLVCVDPVSTGYSRPAPGVDKKRFHGVDEDGESMARFIQQFVTKKGLWESPKFLMGESYGTTRAAVLADRLQSRYGMECAGVALVSAVLDFNATHTGHDLLHQVMLPSFTATAWYHKKLAPDLQAKPLTELLREVEEFAVTQYNVALMRGDALAAKERKAVTTKLARYLGLSEQYVTDANLRVTLGRFAKELRRDERLTVGRLDSRYRGRDEDAAGERYGYDPSMSAIRGPYSETLYRYLTELGWDHDTVPGPYEILTGKVHPWKWGRADHRYTTNVAPRLRKAMTRNPYLKVFVANGYYDLATPYFATQYTFDHMQLEGPAKRNVTMTYYEAGHMMYIHGPSLAKMRTDLVAWYADALKETTPEAGEGF